MAVVTAIDPSFDGVEIVVSSIKPPRKIEIILKHEWVNFAAALVKMLQVYNVTILQSQHGLCRKVESLYHFLDFLSHSILPSFGSIGLNPCSRMNLDSSQRSAETLRVPGLTIKLS